VSRHDDLPNGAQAGARVQPAFNRYLAIVAALRSKGWDAAAFLLVSTGHENRAELEALGRSGIRLILWEDALRLLYAYDCFRSIFDMDITQYFSGPLSGSD